jgi:hypothetical protein
VLRMVSMETSLSDLKQCLQVPIFNTPPPSIVNSSPPPAILVYFLPLTGGNLANFLANFYCLRKLVTCNCSVLQASFLPNCNKYLINFFITEVFHYLLRLRYRNNTKKSMPTSSLKHIVIMMTVLCTGASLYAPYSLLLISNKFWMGGGGWGRWGRSARVGGGE